MAVRSYSPCRPIRQLGSNGFRQTRLLAALVAVGGPFLVNSPPAPLFVQPNYPPPESVATRPDLQLSKSARSLSRARGHRISDGKCLIKQGVSNISRRSLEDFCG